MRLPVLAPADGLAGDEALLSTVSTTPLVRWWLPSLPAVVVGMRVSPTVVGDALKRQAGGGAVLIDDQILCGAVCLPIADVVPDVTESYRWLGDWLASVVGGRRVEVDAARADVARLRAQAAHATPPDQAAQAEQKRELARLLLACCYGALSPHELTDSAGRKIVGLAQVRRRHAALFQIGILFRDQSPLADRLDLAPRHREALRTALRQRSGAVSSTPRQVFEAVAASWDATPYAR